MGTYRAAICLSVRLSVCQSVFWHVVLSFWHPVNILNKFCFENSKKNKSGLFSCPAILPYCHSVSPSLCLSVWRTVYLPACLTDFLTSCWHSEQLLFWQLSWKDFMSFYISVCLSIFLSLSSLSHLSPTCYLCYLSSCQTFYLVLNESIQDESCMTSEWILVVYYLYTKLILNEFYIIRIS